MAFPAGKSLFSKSPKEPQNGSAFNSTSTSASDLASIFGAKVTQPQDPMSDLETAIANARKASQDASQKHYRDSNQNSSEDSGPSARSAKDIINARYGQAPVSQPNTRPRPALSARDAINAASAAAKAAQAAQARAQQLGQSDQSGQLQQNLAGTTSSLSPSSPSSRAKPGNQAVNPELALSAVQGLAPAARPVEATSFTSAKSASRLHHGFIQKSLESTRTSASALLKTSQGQSSRAPVVKTSLKLGAEARPKRPVVTLPPGARMARSARPVDRSGKLLSRVSRARALEKRSIDAQVVLPDNAPPRANNPNVMANSDQAPSPKSPTSIAITDGNAAPKPRHLAPPAPVSQIPVTGSRSRSITVESLDDEPTPSPSAKQLRRASRPARRSILGGSRPATPTQQMLSDPQMRRPGSQPYSHPRPQSQPQTAPNRPAQNIPEISIDEIMLERPSLAQPQIHPQPQVQPQTQPLAQPQLPSELAGKTVGDLGVIEDYEPHSAAPLANQAAATPGINSRDPKNPNLRKANDSHRTLGKQSPFFLKTVNVEKRPLSQDNAGIAAMPTAMRREVRSADSAAHYALSAAAQPEPAESRPKAKLLKSSKQKSPKPQKTSRFGNVRTLSRSGSHLDREERPKKSDKRDLPDRPTVIVPSSHRSNAPLFFLVILTVVLGAAVGAAAYLCFFQ